MPLFLHMQKFVFLVTQLIKDQCNGDQKRIKLENVKNKYFGVQQGATKWPKSFSKGVDAIR